MNGKLSSTKQQNLKLKSKLKNVKKKHFNCTLATATIVSKFLSSSKSDELHSNNFRIVKTKQRLCRMYPVANILLKNKAPSRTYMHTCISSLTINRDDTLINECTKP